MTGKPVLGIKSFVPQLRIQIAGRLSIEFKRIFPLSGPGPLRFLQTFVANDD